MTSVVPTQPPFSLAARTLLATGLTLMVLLGLVGFSLDKAFIDSAKRDERARLHDVGLTLLAQLSTDEKGNLIAPPKWLSHLTTPNGNVFVNVQLLEPTGWHLVSENTPDNLWTDYDEKENDVQNPVSIETDEGSFFVLTQQLRSASRKGSHIMRFQIAESANTLQIHVVDYRKTLLWSLLLLAFGVLGLQGILLRWSLRPVRRLTGAVREVANGDKHQVPTDNLPTEVEPLAEYVNGLISHNNTQLSRYRNTCADLAHSLRTPLAVMRAQIEDSVFGGVMPTPMELIGQIERMDKVVTGQLARASTGGRSTHAQPILAFKHAESLALGLEKLHTARSIFCEFEVDEAALFYGSEGDLLDLMGNLLDNAFKWAKTRVLLRIEVLPGQKHPGLLIGVEDDGPGVEHEKIDLVLSRGGRTDEQVEGHGLGLSAVQDMVYAYQAEFEIGTSEELSGASFVVRFPG